MYNKWKVSSAGVNALTRRFPQLGETPHTAVLSYLRERKNIHNYMHNSQQISKKLLHQYYWIIVMETAHKEFIDKLGVPLETRMFTMREFGLITPPKELDMPDPTGGPDRNHYLSKFDIIDKEIPRIFDVLTNNIFQLENPDY